MYKRGNAWYTDFIHDGERYRKSWGNISKTVAREKEEKFKTEVREGKHRAKAKRILFETLADKYLKEAETKKKQSTYKRNKSQVVILKSFFSGKLASKIDSFMVERFKKSRKDSGTNIATINRDVSLLRNMFKWAIKNGYARNNPLDDVTRYKEDDRRMWVLTPEEEERLLKECGKRPQNVGGKYLKDLVLFAINTGMRQGEIFSLKKINVDIDKHTMYVTNTKTDKDREVPINDTVLEILNRRMKIDSEYVFCNYKGKRLTVLTNAFIRAVIDAGLVEKRSLNGKDVDVRFRFHDCRHTFGTRLGKIAPLKTIMEIMGHTTHIMAMRYQHPDFEHKLDVVRLLDVTKSTTPKNGHQFSFINTD